MQIGSPIGYGGLCIDAADCNSKATRASAAFVQDDILEIPALIPWVEGFGKLSS
jgi:hypothetical protein